MHALKYSTNSKELARDTVGLLFWCSAEANLGITCACLPTIRPIIATIFPRFMTGDSRQQQALQYGPKATLTSHSMPDKSFADAETGMPDFGVLTSDISNNNKNNTKNHSEKDHFVTLITTTLSPGLGRAAENVQVSRKVLSLPVAPMEDEEPPPPRYHWSVSGPAGPRQHGYVHY